MEKNENFGFGKTAKLCLKVLLKLERMHEYIDSIKENTYIGSSNESKPSYFLI